MNRSAESGTEEEGGARLVERVRLLAASPRQAFASILEGRPWVDVFMVLSLGSALASCLSLYLAGDRLELLPAGLLTEAQQNVVAVLRFAAIVLMAFPITLVSLLAPAFFLWLLVQLFEEWSDFRGILAVVAHASLVLLLSQAADTLLLVGRLQGAEAVSVSEMGTQFDLGLLFDLGGAPVLAILLSYTSPFKIWFYGLLVLGIGRACRLTWPRSAGVVALLLVASVALRVSFTFLADTASESLTDTRDCAACELLPR
ncbi:MAG: hypothetical protein J4F37_13935 [Acidobacteria bacterium]|nr:hypothetical protein [Acidobacteriota bacterium]